MPLFVCDDCGAVDNTACGGSYWIRNKTEKVLCCECYTGKWHDDFEKKIADEDYIKNYSSHFIYLGKFQHLRKKTDPFQ
jgi:hypothetical protein